jgi:double-strand break repair protein MRE11
MTGGGATGDPDALRILVATDNHLGVHEKDQVRKDDAFITFREIFEIAKREKVDAVFLGGDLFDVNKPSRETMVRTMEILREYCLNDDPVQLEVLSDQAVNFPRCVPGRHLARDVFPGCLEPRDPPGSDPSH